MMKYAINTEESTSDACNVERLKDFFKWGIKTGSRLCTNPHRKKRDVIMIKGKRYLFFVIRFMFGFSKVTKTKHKSFYHFIILFNDFGITSNKALAHLQFFLDIAHVHSEFLIRLN